MNVVETMNKENKNLKVILDNNWFVPEFKPIIEKYSWFGEHQYVFPTGKYESFYRTLNVTREEFDSVELGDYIKDEIFSIQGIEIRMDANIVSCYAEEGIFPGYCLGVAFYPKMEIIKYVNDRCNCCDDSGYDEFEEDIYECEQCKGFGEQVDDALNASEVWELWEKNSELYFDSIEKSGYYYKHGDMIYFTCGDPTCCWDEYDKDEFLKLDDIFGKRDE